jgi:hypothetical protein
MKQLISDAETTITHIQEDSSKVADDNDRATLESVMGIWSPLTRHSRNWDWIGFGQMIFITNC